MANFRMCEGKVRFRTELDAFVEAQHQLSQRPHWRWSWYECLWCDYWHIGRNREAPGHSERCLVACNRQGSQERECLSGDERP